jgi:CAAX protease family protein
MWHLPQYAVLPEWVQQNGGADPASILAFLLLVMALSPLMTWLFNHTRGSVLMSILTHASVNTALVLVPGQLFPAAGTDLAPFALAFSIMAIVLVVRTRARLGQLPQGGYCSEHEAGCPEMGDRTDYENRPRSEARAPLG